jgi:DnaJ-class molecular chaperone
MFDFGTTWRYSCLMHDYGGPTPCPRCSTQVWPWPAATAHRCPVCEGKGKLPAQFYDAFSSSGKPTMCRSCFGRGIVWQ